MNSEFKDQGQEVVEESVDRTKWIWLCLGVAIVGMLGLLWLQGPATPPYSHVRVRHILVKADFTDAVDRQRAQDLIKELRERIEQGESFAKIAREYSDDEHSAKRGGKLPPARQGTYSDAFDHYVWTAPVGELSEPIRTEYGYHLVEVLERHLSEVDAHLLQQDDEVRSGAAEPEAAEGQQ